MFRLRYDGTSDGISSIWRHRLSSWALGLLHTSDPGDRARSATFSSDDDFSLAPSKSLFQSIYFSSRGMIPSRKKGFCYAIRFSVVKVELDPRMAFE